MSTIHKSIRRHAANLVEEVQKSVRHRPGERAALRRSLGITPAELARTRPVACRVVVPHVAALDEELGEQKKLRPRQRDFLERSFYTVAALVAHQPRFVEDQDADDEDTKTRGEATETETMGGKHTQAGEGNSAAEPPRQEEKIDLGAALALSALRQSSDRQGERGDPRDLGSDQRWVAPQEKRLHLLCRQDLDGLYRHLPRVMALLRSQAVTPDWIGLASDLYTWGSAGGRDRIAKKWLDSYYRKLSAPLTGTTR